MTANVQWALPSWSPAHRFGKAWNAASPALLFGLRFWASMSLAVYVALWLQLDNAFWAGTSAAIVCQPQLGASLRKGWFLMVGTMIGATMSVVLIACFPQDRVLFLSSLTVWVAVCAFAATVLRNFASYAAAHAGFTVPIIAGGLYGPTGGVNADAALLLALARATEICIGIVCAGIILAGTDFGGARRRLAAQFADLSVAITAGFVRTLTTAGQEFVDTQPARHEFVRRVIALDPIIDQTVGESSRIRYHSPVLQRAVDGLFTALRGWRAVANHLDELPADESRQEAVAVLENLPPELGSASQPGASERWIGNPVTLHSICGTIVRRLIELPVGTPSLRLLADNMAETFAGIAHALNGLALLVADPARSIPRRGSKHLRVPDWLPAVVNACRAFVTIAAVALFWIITAWPGGGSAITFAALVGLLFAPRADQAYGGALFFTLGIAMVVVVTAVIEFAVLPRLGIERFVGFSLVLAVCLVPIGALLAQARRPWQLGLFTGMAILFMPLLQPANSMTYDPEAFYNASSAIVFGAGCAALSFRLLPPLSPAFRTRRLLALTLRDVRRLAMRRGHNDWQGHVHGRLSAMPEQATPLQRAQLLAALSAGMEIIYLHHIARHLGFGRQLDAALEPLASAQSAQTITQLSQLDDVLAADATGGAAVVRARASIIALAQLLAKHSAFFDGARP
jgi:uncharacterized membrane protein YccC